MKTTYTRAEIFDLLWEIPTTKVAKQLGISDVALTKWCAKNSIPKPPLGYWAKKEHGKPVPAKPELVPWKSGENEPVYYAHDPKPEKLLEPSEASEEEVLSELKLYIGEQFHPAVIETFKGMKDGRVNRYGRWESSKGFELQISPESAARAMRILQTLINGFASQGARVGDYRRFSNYVPRAAIYINDEPFLVHCYEVANRQIPPLKKKASWTRPDGSIHYYDTHVDYLPSGRLELRIRHPDLYSEKVLRDTAGQRIEDSLGEIPRAINRFIKEARIERKMAEIEQKRVELERQAETARKELIARKQRQWEALRESSISWNNMELIRQFIEAVRSDMIVREKQPDWEKWVDWASNEVNQRDPIYQLKSGGSLPGVD